MIVKIDFNDLSEILGDLSEILGDLPGDVKKRFMDRMEERVDPINLLRSFVNQYDADCMIESLASKCAWDVIRAVARNLADLLKSNHDKGLEATCGLEVGRTAAAAIRTVADTIEKAVEAVRSEEDHSVCKH